MLKASPVLNPKSCSITTPIRIEVANNGYIITFETEVDHKYIVERRIALSKQQVLVEMELLLDKYFE